MASNDVQYPNVTVQLTGEDGNAFYIIGAISKAIRASEGAEAATEYRDNAMASGSYDDLLRHAMKTVNVE